jgi:hypothetical protein
MSLVTCHLNVYEYISTTTTDHVDGFRAVVGKEWPLDVVLGSEGVWVVVWRSCRTFVRPIASYVNSSMTAVVGSCVTGVSFCKYRIFKITKEAQC